MFRDTCKRLRLLLWPYASFSGGGPVGHYPPPLVKSIYIRQKNRRVGRPPSLPTSACDFSILLVQPPPCCTRTLPSTSFCTTPSPLPLPPPFSLYKTKPSEYIGHLVGHEGEGSVLSLLRHKRWATGISAGISGSGFNSSSCCATFSVTFYLTKARKFET